MSGIVEDYSSLVLDIGNVSFDVVSILSNEIKSTELNLNDAWKTLDIGNKIMIRFGNDSDSLTQRLYTINETVEAMNKYPIVYWVPQLFYNPISATVKYMKEVRSICVDLDSKVDPLFWNKLAELFSIWGKGETVKGIPCPTLWTYSGNGVHLYWLLDHQNSNMKQKGMAKLIQRVIQLRLSSLFNSKFDLIHIVQPLRVPGSKTKNGDACRAFRVQGGFHGHSLYSFAIQFFSHSELVWLNAYLNGDTKYTEFHTNITIGYGYTSDTGKEDQEKLVYPPIATVVDLIEIKDPFNPSSIEIFSDIIDNEYSIHNKGFIKKCIYSIKIQSPLHEGVRNNRFFALAVALAKSGATREVMCKIVGMANEIYCDEPLDSKSLRCCTVDPYKYIYMTSYKLKQYLGIANWPTFTNIESSMTRQDAAKVAAKTNHERTINDLISGYMNLGFNANVSDLCKAANISRATYYNYKKNGTLQSILNRFINISNDESRKNAEFINLLREENKESIQYIENTTSNIDGVFLALQSKELSGIPF